MKRTVTVAVVLTFTLMMVAPLFAQEASSLIAQKIAKGRSGNFKGTVVSCDVKANTCIVKTTNGNKTGNMNYASYNGSFNAAKELKPGDKVMGHWQEVEGVIYVTMVVEQ